MSKDIILGIDPGYDRMGWGVIEKKGGDWKVVDYGCVQTLKKDSLVDRLFEISEEMTRVIKKFKPVCVGVEDLFFSKNAKTAIKVGQARGVILLTARKSNLEILEFNPTEIKQQISGSGRADKKQMQQMIALMLGLKENIKQDDAADALAVAYCAGQEFIFKNRLK